MDVREELVPICVERVELQTDLGAVVRENVKYYNVVVRDCPPYVANPNVPNGFIRAAQIARLKHATLAGTGLCWPDHPKDASGDHCGAIIILVSQDNKILILRNGALWGLPKGVRNYRKFHDLKSACHEQYVRTGKAPVFPPIVFDQVESPTENICRETLEETGIELKVENLIQWEGADAYTRFVCYLDFAADQYGEILARNGTDYENDEIKWIDIKELQCMLLTHKSNRQIKIFNHVTFLFLTSYALKLKMHLV
jgi:8-oxo-dGTP pyrophosphatase MutT (NUDIX family)